jgi:hypothetical protein
MGYDDDFYKAYMDYLSEATVRQAHDWIFALSLTDPNFQNVVDFGCGKFNEFLRYARPKSYVGIDLNVSQEENSGRLIQADYRKIDNLTSLISPDTPLAFVSLFSTEITAPTEENYELYERIFTELPTIQSGLVSGFYYAGKTGQNPIKEAGDIVSYQTLERIEDVASDRFTERRIILPVPSQMFGEDVFEVWKFFARKEGN